MTKMDSSQRFSMAAVLSLDSQWPPILTILQKTSWQYVVWVEVERVGLSASPKVAWVVSPKLRDVM